MNGTEFQLSLINWQLFGTATWRSSCLGSVASRERDLWGFLKDWTCWRSLTTFSRLHIVVRWERGEVGDRPHAHFLISGLESRFVNVGSCFQANAQWKERAGFMKLRLFDRRLARGAHYLTAYKSVDGNTYELRKFDRADRLVFSPGVWEKLQEITHAAKSPRSVTI